MNDKYEEDVESALPSASTTAPPPPPPAGTLQYSPDFTISSPYPSASQQIINQLTVSQAVPSVTSQDPDGVTWLDWTGTTWDGNPINPSGMTPTQMCQFLRPTGSPYAVRGIRELFYQHNPFADNQNPTVMEINNWNVIVINHIRAMLGYTIQVVNDARLYLETRWADERKWTQSWDTAYPLQGGLMYGQAPGPCHDTGGNLIDIAGGHCGASFFPNATDRAAYLSAAPYNNDFTSYPELSNYQNRFSQSEQVKTVNTDLPWSIKMAVIMSGWICGEGTTGHAGPFLTRQRFGAHWHVNHNGVHGTVVRTKFT